MEIIELEDSFQLCTRKEYYDALIRVAKQPKKYSLTDVQLEVLSVVHTDSRLHVRRLRRSAA